MNQPDWVIVTVIGAFIGFPFPYGMKLLQFVIRRFQRDFVEGQWHVYHVSSQNGEVQAVYSTWTIKKGVFSKFVVHDNRKNLPRGYRGILLSERNFWLIRLNAIQHQEEVLIRLHSPIATQDAITWGLYLGLDFEGNASSGPVMISRKQIPTDDVLPLLLEKVKVNGKLKLLAV
jgi:hypothetical protein